MAAHARLKNEFMEDEKYHNLITWLIFSFGVPLYLKFDSNDKDNLRWPVPWKEFAELWTKAI